MKLFEGLRTLKQRSLHALLMGRDPRRTKEAAARQSDFPVRFAKWTAGILAVLAALLGGLLLTEVHLPIEKPGLLWLGLLVASYSALSAGQKVERRWQERRQRFDG